MLGNSKIENYSEDLIKKLYERFSVPSYIDTMHKNNSRFFLDFAK